MKTKSRFGRKILSIGFIILLSACATTDESLKETGGAPKTTVELSTSLPLPQLPLKTFTNTMGMEFVFIPPGDFIMGSPLSEYERRPDEVRHLVKFAKGYYIQTTETTQGQWKKIMGKNPSHYDKCGDNCPVETVSWDDIQEFLNKLNVLEGSKKYRLPTEAEWEYACRAGTRTPFSCGRCLSTDHANYNGEYPYKGCPDGKDRNKIIPVASLSPNPWGIYDMHGNVWEWCHDWMGPYSSRPVVDPVGPSTGEKRIYRGGSQNDKAEYSRSAFRGQFKPHRRSGSLGFRLAISP